jgi:hypothetical protein
LKTVYDRWPNFGNRGKYYKYCKAEGKVATKAGYQSGKKQRKPYRGDFIVYKSTLMGV